MVSFGVLTNTKPPILNILQDYGMAPKFRGKKAVFLCPFHQERNPSFTVWPEGNRFYCFGCGESGSSLDLLAYFTGRPITEILREYYNEPEDIERKRTVKARQNIDVMRDRCYSRLAKVYRDTIKAESEIAASVDDSSANLMANVYSLREIIWPLLDDLAGLDNQIVQAAINEAKARGLFTE